MDMNEFIVFYQLLFDRNVALPKGVDNKAFIDGVMNRTYKEIESGNSKSFNGKHDKVKNDIIDSLIKYFEKREHYEKCQKLLSIKKVYKGLQNKPNGDNIDNL